MPIRLFTFAPPPPPLLPLFHPLLTFSKLILTYLSLLYYDRTKNTLATFLALTGAGVLAANMNNAKPRAEKEDHTNGEGGFALRGCERSGFFPPFFFESALSTIHNNGLG